MAKKTEKKKQKFVGDIIKNAGITFNNQRINIRAVQESEFLRNVIDNGLDSNTQLEYRKKQLEEEKKKSTPDADFVSEIENEMSRLNDQIRSEKFRAAYRASFQELQAQSKNYDQHISFLNEQLSAVTDPVLKESIREKISTATTNKFAANDRAIQNKASLAIQDKSLSGINSSIQEMSVKRAQAAASGNNEAVTRWDLAISSLNANRNTIEIQDRFNEFEISGLNGNRGALATFDFYRNNLISSTEDNAPMIINGVRYNSAKEYWQGRFNNFVENNFFNLYQQELNDKILTSSRRLTPVLESQLKSINSELGDLFSFPEMNVFTDKLNNLRTNVNFAGASKLGEKIYDDYINGRMGSTTIANFNNAINKLRSINRDFDVDVTSFINTIINDLNQKKQVVAQAQAQLIAEEGLTPEQAAQAIPAVDIPAPIVASQTPSETAQQIVEGAGGPFDISQPAETELPIEPPKTDFGVEPFSNEPLATQASATAPKVEPVSVPEPVPAGQKSREITVQRGETLSAISLRELGDAGRFQEIADFNQLKDPNKIEEGQKLRIQVT